jgi:hypothetical protein
VTNDEARAVLAAQAAYYLVTGVWPVVHLRSFEAITGPKASGWLVKTIGGLIAVVGLALGVAWRRGRADGDTVVLGAGSALALGTSDFVYGGSGRISRVYLADGVAQALILAGWVRAAAADEATPADRESA